MSQAEITKDEAIEILDQHKQFYKSYQTFNIDFRIEQLNRLKASIKAYAPQIEKALLKDLGKPSFEAYTTEISLVLSSITYTLKHLKKWANPKKVSTPLYLFPSKSFIMQEPYGTVLIIGPYNYPFQLLIEPLIGAIAAGNCVVLKPSEITPHVAAIVTQMIEDTFDLAYVRSITGGIETNIALTHASFDYIFFTGSIRIGKMIMEAAAKNLVPVTLELGGKSPVIVEQSANLASSAQRIIWGKMLNAGQTCVAPDYVLVHSSIKASLIKEMIRVLISFYGHSPKASQDLGRIVNLSHFNRLQNILYADKEKIIYGGETSKEDLFIAPTLIEAASFDMACMADEIFGPILPIMSYDDLNQALDLINNHPKPLALYLFTENTSIKRKVLKEVSFGGGFINDTITHLVNPKLPFGGVGASGMGAYHGYASFTTFSHAKSIMTKTTRLNIPLVFPPYSPEKLKIIRKFME